MEGFGLLIAAYLAAGGIGLVLVLVATARRLSRDCIEEGPRSRHVVRSLAASWVSLVLYLASGLTAGRSSGTTPIAVCASLSFLSALLSLALAIRAQGTARIPSAVAAAWLSLLWIPVILFAGGSWFAAR